LETDALRTPHLPRLPVPERRWRETRHVGLRPVGPPVVLQLAHDVIEQRITIRTLGPVLCPWCLLQFLTPSTGSRGREPPIADLRPSHARPPAPVSGSR